MAGRDDATFAPGRPGPQPITNGSGLRVRIPGGPYHYPDGLLHPFPGDFEEGPPASPRTLRDPVALGEILSPTTARQDRSEKRIADHAIPTVLYDLSIRPNVRDVRLLVRDGKRWGETRPRAADPAVELPRLGPSLPMDRLYRGTRPGGGRVP